MRRPRQLVLELPHRSALGAEDFLVSEANRRAVELIDCWPDWPSRAVIVVGPAGSGKSHLATVWQKSSNAHSGRAGKINDNCIAALEQRKALVIEDIDRGIGDERILFHLLNLSRQESVYLLLTTRVPPGNIDIGLPDLRSRLRALPIAVIDLPDEVLLKAVLVKLFQDRQLNIEPAVINFITLRMERSMESANRIVAAIDQLALETQRRVTRRLAQTALNQTSTKHGST